MLDDEIAAKFGHVELEPKSTIIAGEYGTWRLVYRVGAVGIQPGGRIEIDTDTDTDWGLAQVQDPRADEYLTVEMPDGAGVVIQIASNKKQQCIVTNRALVEGEAVTITFGDRRWGSRGSRAQTYAEPRHSFRVRVDTKGNGEWRYLPSSPEVAITGGSAARITLQATSLVTVDETFQILLRVEDQWGNPATLYEGEVELSADGLDVPVDRVKFEPGAEAVMRIDGCTASSAGVFRIQAQGRENDLLAESNPVEARETPSEFQLRWGDLHGGQVFDANKIDEFFRYARDVAGIEFVGYQRNDHAMSPADYRIQQRLEREYYQPGSFVPVPGYEWSAYTENGGHHNVFFRRFDQPARRNSHRALSDKSEQHLDLPHITDVYDAFRGTDTMITPHVGGEHSNLDFHDPLLEPAFEVTSDHGSFPWFLEWALSNGYRMGFLGGSDSHNARPGYDHPGYQLRRYSKSGITGLYTKELSVEGVFEAVRARRCYATTGARMIATVYADGHFLGSEYQTDRAPTIEASIEGTGKLEEVILFRGLEEVYRQRLVSERSERRIRISWEGAGRESSYSGLIWDGQLTAVDGAIRIVRTFRFDSPRSRVSQSADDHLTWHSWTCGYRSGMIIEFDEDSRLDITIATSSLTRAPFGGRGRSEEHVAIAQRDQIRLSVRPGELNDGSLEVALGELGRKVTVELEPVSHTTSARFSFTDQQPVEGINPYWVHAIQQDGEMLWTSPVFVDYAKPGA